MLLVSGSALFGCEGNGGKSSGRLLHVSYDPTREFFEAYNQLFISRWQQEKHQMVSIAQSHGGSGKQARAVVEGLPADIVSLALAFDIDQISKSGAIATNWQARLPEGSSPFYSTVVFLVRKGNPHKLRDWADLSRPGIEVVMPNPKTSGGARWNYLAAWASALDRNGQSEESAGRDLRQLFKNVLVFDSGARGAATTFVERELGDVLLTWENDAWLIKESDRGVNFEIIYPSVSVRAEPVVAVVDRTVDRRGSRELANAYLDGLYSSEAQQLLTDYHFRSIDEKLMRTMSQKYPSLKLFSVRDFGGWNDFQRKHFRDGGLFDTFLGDD